MRRALFVVAAFLIAGCGQNGDLFLPPTAMPERVPANDATTTNNDNDNNSAPVTKSDEDDDTSD